jgi:hypothetical protein
MQRTTDGNLRIGKELTEDQLSALKKTGLTGEQVLDNLDGLNEEILETVNESGQKLPEHSVPKVQKKLSRGQNKMTLDDELDLLNKQLDEKTNEKEEEETQEIEEEEAEAVNPTDSIKDQVLNLLQSSKNAPDQRKINAWKVKHGKNSIYAIGMGEGDVYVFTHLKRGQWKKIQEIIGKMSANDERFDAQDEMKKKVVQYCTLFPAPLPIEFFYNSRAGVLDALYEAVLLNSYFLSPQQTMMLTTQL